MKYFILVSLFLASCTNKPLVHTSNLNLKKTKYFIVGSTKDKPAKLDKGKEQNTLRFDLVLKNSSLNEMNVSLVKAFFEVRGENFPTTCSFYDSNTKEKTFEKNELSRFICEVKLPKIHKEFSKTDTEGSLIIPLKGDVINILFRMRLEDFR